MVAGDSHSCHGAFRMGNLLTVRSQSFSSMLSGRVKHVHSSQKMLAPLAGASFIEGIFAQSRMFTDFLEY